MLQASFTELKEKACKAYNLEEVDVVMWDYWGDNYYGTDGPLDDYPDERLSKGKLMDKQPVMLLEKVMLAPCPEPLSLCSLALASSQAVGVLYTAAHAQHPVLMM